MQESPNSLTRKLNKIIQSEIADAQHQGSGKTDVETVFQRVKARCKNFLHDLAFLFFDRYLRLLIGHKLKHRNNGAGYGRRRRDPAGAAGPDLSPGADKQYVFPGMEEFRGYPEQLTYEDKPGHVIFVDARKSLEYDRAEAEKYAEKLTKWHIRRTTRLKKGNRFARRLLKLYGDLPLETLVEQWQADHGDEDLTEAE